MWQSTLSLVGKDNLPASNNSCSPEVTLVRFARVSGQHNRALQRDDGWQGMGGEEQALLYTLEEISGSDYCLREDTFGGSQVRHHATAVHLVQQYRNVDSSPSLS